MIKTFAAMDENPLIAAEQATTKANDWLAIENQVRESRARVPLVFKNFVTTMTIAPALVDDRPDWYTFTITATYSI